MMRYAGHFLGIIATVTVLSAYGFGQKSFFTTRSQGQDLARELVGWEQEIHLYDAGPWYTTVAVTAEYMRSFHPADIAQFTLGCPRLVFSGSQRTDRLPTDILADYFGLPGTFASTVCFTPTITNFVMDLNWFLGFDALLCGLWVQAHLPIVHSKWDLKFQECVLDGGTTTTAYPAGYLSDQDILRSSLPKNVRESFEGKTRFGDMQTPLEFGKIFGRQTIDRVADLQVSIGWDFLLSPTYHLGLFLRATAPTGNASKAEFFFEAMAGNGHHWELGPGLTGHIIAWKRECHQIALWGIGYIGHLFTSEQRRSYDLCNNCPGSRYMLLERIGAPAQDLHVGQAPNDQLAANQYQGRLVPAINLTTLKTEISLDYQVDLLLKLAYQREDGLEFDFGYEFWARSEEKVSCRECFPNNCFAIKGDSQIYGFTDPAQQPIKLNPSQSMATVHAGQGEGNFTVGQEFSNANVDSPAVASDSSGTPLFQVTTADAVTLGIAQTTISTSDPLVFVSDADIDVCSGILPKAHSNKLFAHLNKAWDDPCVRPYLGIGGMVEWATPNVFSNSAFSQWGIWLKGGLSY